MQHTISRFSLLLASGLILAPAFSQASTYGATAIVAQSGGDYTDPVAAMADVGTWCGTPSDANRCLVKMMPGSYDISGSVLEMQSWVDVLGSGENNTVVTGSGTSYGGGSPILVRAIQDATLGEMTVHMVQTPGTVVSMNNGHMRDMTVSWLVGGSVSGVLVANGEALLERVKINGSGHGWMQGIYSIYNSTLTLRDVDVYISPSNQVYGSTCIGIYTQGGVSDMNTVDVECRDNKGQNNPIRNYGTNAKMRNVTATAVGASETTAILVRQLYGEKVVLERVSAEGYNKTSGASGGYGVKVFGTGAGTVQVRNSSIKGNTNGMVTYDTTTSVVTNSNVTGGVNVTSGTVTCGGNTDDNGVFYASVCP